MTLLLIIGALVCAWAVLIVFSGERERRMADHELHPHPHPTPPAPPETPPPSPR